MNIGYILNEARYYSRLGGLGRAFKKFILCETPLKKIVNSKSYSNFYSGVISRKSNKIEPRILQIENTNVCNAKCIMCPHTIMKRKTKIMLLEDFKKVLENVMRDYNIERLVITGFGEPFADRGIIDKIKFANSQFPQLKIDVYTNASLIDERTACELLKTRVDRITFSINGTRENYTRIMGLDYDKTQKNVLFFLKKRSETRNKVLVNMSLMILKENESSIRDFIEFWRKRVDSVRVYAPSDWGGKMKDIVSRPVFKKKRWPCFGLWGNITVDVEGNLIMCCRDYESRVKFGSLIKESARKIRESEKFQGLLKKQLEFDFKTPICSGCDNSFDSSLDWIC